MIVAFSCFIVSVYKANMITAKDSTLSSVLLQSAGPVAVVIAGCGALTYSHSKRIMSLIAPQMNDAGSKGSDCFPIMSFYPFNKKAMRHF